MDRITADGQDGRIVVSPEAQEGIRAASIEADKRARRMMRRMQVPPEDMARRINI